MTLWKLTKLSRIRLLVWVFVVSAIMMIWITLLVQDLTKLFVSFVREMPTLSTGLLGTLGIYGVLGATSSKQMYRVNYYDSVGHAGFGATSQFLVAQEYRPTLDVFLQKSIVKFDEAVAFDNPILIAWDIYQEQESDTALDSSYGVDDYLDGFGSADNASAFVRDTKIGLATFGWTTGESVQRHEQEHMLFLEKGAAINLAMYAKDWSATAPTAGSIYYSITLVFIVINYYRSSRRPRNYHDPYLHIWGGKFDADTDQYTFIPNIDMRLYAIRMDLFGDIAAYDSLVMHNKDAPDTYFQANTTGITSELIDIETVVTLDPQASYVNAVGIQRVTRFIKGPIHMNKSEPWTITLNSEDSADLGYMITAQVMPGYKNKADFAVINTFPCSSSAEKRYFRIPYDLYITQIELEIVAEVAAATSVDGYVDLMGIKRGNFTVTGASTGQGMILSETGATDEILSPAILDRVLVTFNHSAATDKRITTITSLEIVNDYYEAGSHIGLHTSSLNSLTDNTGLVITMKIEGFNPRIYREKYAKRSWVDGTTILPYGQPGGSRL